MSDLRKLTIYGEQAMERAGNEARAMLEFYGNDIVRSYAATGLLMVAMAELTTGVPRESAIETLKQALLDLGGMPS